MKLRHAVSDAPLESMESYERFNYNALQILEGGYHSFKEFAFELLDDEGEEVLPYIKSLYHGFLFFPNLEEHQQFMDSPQVVASYNMDDLLEEWKNNFRFQEEDFYAIEIARSVMNKLLHHRNISPKAIVGIGHYLYALDRLPVKTDGIDVSIDITYRNGDERFHEIKMYSFLITEEVFHIDISGYQHDAAIGGDSISYPGWYVEKTGGRNCKCELAYLEGEIDEIINLGASITTEDFSRIEEMDESE